MSNVTGNMVGKKECRKCKRVKGLQGFNRQSASKDGFRRECRACQNKDNSTWWRKNPDKRATQIANNAKRIQRNRDYVLAYLQDHPCMDCEEDDVVVLEFHHLDPSLKVKAVSQLMYETTSLKRIQEEIDKCEVICANCHRRRTAREQKWFKLGVTK